MSDINKRSTLSDEEIAAIDSLMAKDKNTSLETSPESNVTVGYHKDKPLETPPLDTTWLDEEDNRHNRSNPFLISQDTDWIDTLYKALYPLPVSPRHKETFKNILTNISLRKSEMYLQLSKDSYKGMCRPEYFVPSKVSSICSDLETKGYLKVNRGHKYEGSSGVASTIEPTEKLLTLIPDGMSYSIMEEGLVIPKEFTYDSFPQSALDTRALLLEYNKTVEPENMLYASHKGGFEINGRFTGSSVCIMKKEDRKNLKIDGC